MAPVGSYPTGAIALYGEGGVWRLIARALNMRVVYGRSVADNLGIQAPAVSRVACGAPVRRKLCLLPAVRHFAFHALRG